MNSTMVTAIEHHSNQQQAQGPQYGANIQSSMTNNNSPRGGPKSPPLSSPNGMVSPTTGRSQSKKASHAKALSLQTKLAQATGSSKSSPLTALSSPASIPGPSEKGAPSRRGSKRTLEDALVVEKVQFSSLFIIGTLDGEHLGVGSILRIFV